MAISVTKPTSTPKDFFSFFLSTFNDGSIRQMARDTRFIVRSRKMHPELFVRSLVAACSQDKEFSLSSIYQDYRRRCIENDCECMSWEPFYDFLQKPSFIKFVEALLNVANDAAGRATIAGTNKLVETLKTRLPKLKDIILQDGTEISTNCDKYKGTRDPQIKIHRTLSMQSMAEYRCSITSGIKSERGEIRLKALKNRLLIADAGYPAFKLFGRIVKNGGWFLIKLRSNCTLPVSVKEVATFFLGRE